jgi:transposase-like protein
MTTSIPSTLVGDPMPAAETSSPTSIPAPAKRRRGRPRRDPSMHPTKIKAASEPLGDGLDVQSRRRAAGVLEVLAGQRSPQQVAQALGVSLSYFYVLERHALQGLVQACQLKPAGHRGNGLAKQLATAERRLARAESDRQRLEALVRLTQRTLGLSTNNASKESKDSIRKGDKKRRRHRPQVRALRAVVQLTGTERRSMEG